jgi:hypothetical protein
MRPRRRRRRPSSVTARLGLIQRVFDREHGSTRRSGAGARARDTIVRKKRTLFVGKLVEMLWRAALNKCFERGKKQEFFFEVLELFTLPKFGTFFSFSRGLGPRGSNIAFLFLSRFSSPTMLPPWASSPAPTPEAHQGFASSATVALVFFVLGVLVRVENERCVAASMGSKPTMARGRLSLSRAPSLFSPSPSFAPLRSRRGSALVDALSGREARQRLSRGSESKR